MAILTAILPVFNDWQSAARVASALRAEFDRNLSVVDAEILVVDDGSTERPSSEDQTALKQSQAVLLSLPGNVGHQRALVAGIRYSIRDEPDYILVMDADGEDRPAAVTNLIDRAKRHPEAVVVAKRGVRLESPSFRMLYGLHKVIFRLFVGERLDFGNFVLLPLSAARRIGQMPEASAHLAAAILKSRLPIERVTIDRGERHYGNPKMNTERLITHSFSSLSAFAERIMVRLVIFSFFATVVSALVATGVVAVRFFSDLASPGWATTAVGLLIVFSLQFLTFAGIGTLVTLNVSSLRDYLKGETFETKALSAKPFSSKVRAHSSKGSARTAGDLA